MSQKEKRLAPFLFVSAGVHLVLIVLLSVISPLVTGEVIPRGKFFVNIVSHLNADRKSSEKAVVAEPSKPAEEIPTDEEVSELPSDVKESVPEKESSKEPAAPTDEDASPKAPVSAGRLAGTELRQQIAMMDFGQRQMLCMKTRHFYSAIKSLVRSSLGRAIQIESRSTVDGQTAFVEIFYNEAGEISEKAISADSKKLDEVLNDFDWRKIPSPSAFGLPYRRLSLTIFIKNDLIFVD